MKWKYLFPIAFFTIFSMLSGCRHRVSSFISVQDTLTMASVYADKGGTLRWETADETAGNFQIQFLYDNPCDPKDVLNSSANPEVVCHVVGGDGTYIYQILPYPGKTGPTPSTTMQNFAQVGGCRGCRLKTTPPAPTPTNTIYIACDSTTGKAVAVDSPSSVPPQAVLEWKPLGRDPGTSQVNGATFQQSPCTGGTAPYYGSNNTCSVGSTASGSYTYTVNRADCKQKSDPVTLNVQP